MAILDHDGTAYTPVKNVFDHDGTTFTKIKQGFDHDGTAYTQVYSAELDVLADGGWTKIGNESYIQTLSDEEVTIVAKTSGGNARIYKVVDVTNYSTLTLTYELSYRYGHTFVGLYKTEPDYLGGDPAAGKYLAGETGSLSETVSIDVSGLTGNYFAVIGAYCGTSASSGHGTTKCTKFILE